MSERSVGLTPESNVHTLSVAPGPQPNQRIIDALREALRDAKEGKIQGIAIALAVVDANSDADGGRSTESIVVNTKGWEHSISAAVSTLWMRLNYERYIAGAAVPPPKLDDTDE